MPTLNPGPQLRWSTEWTVEATMQWIVMFIINRTTSKKIKLRKQNSRAIMFTCYDKFILERIEVGGPVLLLFPLQWSSSETKSPKWNGKKILLWETIMIQWTTKKTLLRWNIWWCWNFKQSQGRFNARWNSDEDCCPLYIIILKDNKQRSAI